MLKEKFKLILRKVEPKISNIILELIFRSSTRLTSEKLYWNYILLIQRGYRESARLNTHVRKKIFPLKLYSLIASLYIDKKLKVFELGPGPLSDLAWGVEGLPIVWTEYRLV